MSEQVLQLALLHAIAPTLVSHRSTPMRCGWARQVVMHQTRRMLFMAAGRLENRIPRRVLKLMKNCARHRNANSRTSVLLKRMKMRAADFRDLVETLMQRNDIEPVEVATAGRTGVATGCSDGGEG
ncbi:MAG: hypothetical protein M5U09_27995 [Gammaproteobacteria bacterium]|nr:hypothetical protein [Gammaproteobacteria bacterium]